MNKIIIELQNEIQQFFGIQKNEIHNFKKIKKASNIVYYFIVKNKKYIIKKYNDSTINDWKNEKAAYISLKPLNITDELIYYENGIKITEYINNSKRLSYGKSDMIDALNHIRFVHESNANINYNYDIIENLDNYILRCNKSKELKWLKERRNQIDDIQKIIDKLNIPKVLCHGDACAKTNFLRLTDGSIRIIDWEQAGMADPVLDIAIATLHQGFENVDPVWCLQKYFNRIPDKQEFLRLFSFLALNSYTLMAWCLSIEDIENYTYYLNSANIYSESISNYS